MCSSAAQVARLSAAFLERFCDAVSAEKSMDSAAAAKVQREEGTVVFDLLRLLTRLRYPEVTARVRQEAVGTAQGL